VYEIDQGYTVTHEQNMKLVRAAISYVADRITPQMVYWAEQIALQDVHDPAAPMPELPDSERERCERIAAILRAEILADKSMTVDTTPPRQEF
jgi:dihydrodipicolinate synthase/N-acetylneuraminate lyase